MISYLNTTESAVAATAPPGTAFLSARDDVGSMARYFEDLETGDVYELDGRYEFDADERSEERRVGKEC